MTSTTVATGTGGMSRALRRGVIVVSILGLAVAAGVRFGRHLEAEPEFVDEWAYVAQAFYGPLWWSGQWDDRAWLQYGAVDLPPLPKYLIAAALTADGRRLPPRTAASAWYDDTSSRFGSSADLVIARIPSVIFGVLGVLALYVLGRVAVDGRVGLIGAALIIANPLYTVHARRAMADVPTEALALGSITVGLCAWRAIVGGGRSIGPWLAWVVGAGALGGLAVSAKLSGGLGLMTLGAWALLAMALPGPSRMRKAGLVAATGAACAVAYGVFVATNPMLVAHPERPADAPKPPEGLIDRTAAIVAHRVDVSRGGRARFPDDALETTAEKLPVLVVQGFGRFGPLGPRRPDSEIRFDWRQDAAVLMWLPVVLVGAIVAIGHGRSQRRAGAPPTAWALLVQAAVAVVTVGLFLPLAWDRYLISLQAPAALLGSLAMVWTWDRLIGGLRRMASASACEPAQVVEAAP